MYMRFCKYRFTLQRKDYLEKKKKIKNIRMPKECFVT